MRYLVAPIILAVIMILTDQANAGGPTIKYCAHEPNRKRETTSELISRNERIILGQVISARRNSNGEWQGPNVTFSVSILTVLKGDDSPGSFEVDGLRAENLYPINPYVLDVTNRHRDGLENPELPSFGTTEQVLRKNAKNARDCHYAPVLEVGMTYLMFLSKPYYATSFEPVVNTLSDEWYFHVKDVSARQRASLSP